jgi:hypothetical protein
MLRALDDSPPSNLTFALKLVGALLLCTAFWLPLVGWMLISTAVKRIAARRARAAQPPERRFLAEAEALVQRMSVDEIEAREVVADPASHGRGVPFGYLLDGWRAFKEQIRAGDELWQFELNGRNPTGEGAGGDVVATGGGYALVRDGKICAEFVAHADDDTAWRAETLRNARLRSLGNSQHRAPGS